MNSPVSSNFMTAQQSLLFRFPWNAIGAAVSLQPWRKVSFILWYVNLFTLTKGRELSGQREYSSGSNLGKKFIRVEYCVLTFVELFVGWLFDQSHQRL